MKVVSVELAPTERFSLKSTLTFCMLGNFTRFCRPLVIFKINVFEKKQTKENNDSLHAAFFQESKHIETLCMLGKFLHVFCRLLVIFKINVFRRTMTLCTLHSFRNQSTLKLFACWVIFTRFMSSAGYFQN